jgi:dTMP kinase
MIARTHAHTYTNKQKMAQEAKTQGRGAFILFEGLDRCGKTTHSQKLLDFFKSSQLDASVKLMRFPDRSTAIGKMIDAYLKSATDLDDRCVHLLFSANRWELHSAMVKALEEGTTLIVDRYSYSGVAYSVAKGLDIEWCMGPEHGLPAPDVVLYLQVAPEEAAKRGQHGGQERYEKKEMQEKVAKVFQQLMTTKWQTIDTTGEIEQVHARIRDIALQTIQSVGSKLIGKL